MKLLPSRLSARIILATGVVSLVGVLLAGVVQLRLEYRKDRNQLQTDLEELQRSIVPSLQSSLWQVDMDRVGMLLEGIRSIPGVRYVRLDTREGDHVEFGRPLPEPTLDRRYPLRIDDRQPAAIGVLQVQADDAVILENLRFQAAGMLLNAGGMIVVVALLLLFLVRTWITRHLVDLADYATRFGIDALDVPLKLRKRILSGSPDEIDQVATAINGMRTTLAEYVTERRRVELELQEHKAGLEKLVEQRTNELATKNRLLEEQNEEIRRLAGTDSLTGALTRRRFFELADREVSRTARTGEPLSLLMIDIDHFKRINDTFGHQAGDEALRRVCEICAANLRDVDLLARFGGEEFVACLPMVPVEGARVVAERLRMELSRAKVKLCDGRTIGFTASIGVSDLEPNSRDLQEAIGRADRALYQAKRSGRNRVCIADEAALTV